MSHTPFALSASGWPQALGALLVLGQLCAFHHVVRSAVRQGEQRRELTALQAAASLRCNGLRGRSVRDHCLAQLNAAAADTTALRSHMSLAMVAPQEMSRQAARPVR